MITLGIDLSSQAKNTAASLIEWKDGVATAHTPELKCDDDALHRLIDGADAVGIDAPIGWPLAFRSALADWRHETWNTALRDQLRFRATDRFVRAHQGAWPLSVSTDTIALPAMRAMALLQRRGVTDRSGADGRFFEVYPAASLRAWGMESRGYKEFKSQRCVDVRRRILAALRNALPWLTAPDEYADSADALDSLLASLTVRCAALGDTLPPVTEADRAAAVSEGWIHLPTRLPQPTPPVVVSSQAAKGR